MTLARGARLAPLLLPLAAAPRTLPFPIAALPVAMAPARDGSPAHDPTSAGGPSPGGSLPGLAFPVLPSHEAALSEPVDAISVADGSVSAADGSAGASVTRPTHAGIDGSDASSDRSSVPSVDGSPDAPLGASSNRSYPDTAAPGVELAWRVLRLDNGLQVLMHRDPGIPEVAVELWLRGGAADDPPGRPGQAHLFEHTGLPGAHVFSNRENWNRFQAVSRDGNAWTGYDFLRFYTQVEPRGLELALGILADRLGSTADALTAARVERDRNIVLNELRRSNDTQWDVEVAARLAAGTYGAGHPYAHARSGSTEGVQAATPEELQEWHRRHVGAGNALLLVAGDFDPAQAERWVRHYYGRIAPGSTLPAPALPASPAPALREVMEKALPSSAVFLAWPLPAWGTEDGDRMVLFAGVLQERLERHVSASASAITGAEATVELWGAAGQLLVRGDVGTPAGAPAAEALLRAEVDSLLRRGPDAPELDRARARVRGDFVRGLQRPAWLAGAWRCWGWG